MKITNFIICILFAVFAVVQYNDPDPLLWIIYYGFIAIMAGFAVVGKGNKNVIYLGMGVSIIGMVALVPSFIEWLQMGMPTIAGSMKAEAPHIELTREFLGLLLGLSALLYLARQTSSNPK